MVATLKRRPVPVGSNAVACEGPDVSDLGPKAWELLSYQIPKRVPTKEEAQALSLKMLHEGMIKHDIRPFENASVLRHKARMIRKNTPFREKWNFFLLCLCRVLCVLPPVLCVAFLSAALWGWPIAYDLNRSWVIATFSTILFGCSIGLVSLIPEPSVGVSWERFRLDGYKRSELPGYAVQSACELKQACPQATFEIEELIVTIKEKQRAAPDPFLVVKVGPVEYYIEAWDEPGFNRKRVH